MIFAPGATRWTSPATIVPWPKAAGTGEAVSAVPIAAGMTTIVD
jgi:hypothetical protein